MTPRSSAVLRRTTALISTAVLVAFGLAGCGSSDEPTTADTPAQTQNTGDGGDFACNGSGEVVFWHFFEDREADVITEAITNFEALCPDITVKESGGQDDDVIIQAISAGQKIDVALSSAGDQVGVFCSTGAFEDLAARISADGIDMNEIVATAASYSEFQGIRCTLPMLTDSYALMYNQDLFDAAGITEVPKTLDELADAAVKLTTYNDDGSIDVLGLMPFTLYYQMTEWNWATTVDAHFLNEEANASVISADPGWPVFFNWQKDLIEKLGGYDKLNTWFAAIGNQWTEENDFQTGRVAMMFDGEWRTAFIADQAPDMNYGVAPLPMSAEHQDLYGAGFLTGNVIGIPMGAGNPDAAWTFIKYMALNEDAQVQMGNGLKNIPTFLPALNSPKLEVDELYQVFVDAAFNPNSRTIQSSLIGPAPQEMLGDFAERWQSGAETDLTAGLANLSKQVDDQLALAGAG